MLNIASLVDSSENLCAEWLTELGRTVGSRHARMRAIKGGGCGDIKEERGGCGRNNDTIKKCLGQNNGVSKILPRPSKLTWILPSSLPGAKRREG